MVQLMVRGAGSRTQCVDVPLTSDVLGLKQSIQARTGIPVAVQSLIFGGRQLQDAAPLQQYVLRAGSTIQLVYRLLGGKGGFGALLRGQGRDGKVTTNFDACRDLSGRRLRHSLTEAKLAEWQAGAKERELEKIAERHIREQARQALREKSEEVDVEAIRVAQHEAITKTQQAVHDALANNVSSAKHVSGPTEASTSSAKATSSPDGGSLKRKVEAVQPPAAVASSTVAQPAKRSKMLAMLEDVGTDTSDDE